MKKMFIGVLMFFVGCAVFGVIRGVLIVENMQEIVFIYRNAHWFALGVAVIATAVTFKPIKLFVDSLMK